MSKRTTKTDLILKGARERVAAAQAHADLAEIGVREAQGELDRQKAILAAHMDAHSALERDLAPTQRKGKDPKSTAPRRPRTDKGTTRRGLPPSAPNGGDSADSNA